MRAPVALLQQLRGGPENGQLQATPQRSDGPGLTSPWPAVEGGG